MEDTRRAQQFVDDHPIVLFMKGSPNEPRCGFSNRAAPSRVSSPAWRPISVDVLSDRRAIPSVCAWSDFPTMPQVFIHGELIGGSDIAMEMYQDGSLREMFDEGRTA